MIKDDEYSEENINLGYKDIFEIIMGNLNNNMYFKDKDGQFIYVSKVQMERLNEKKLEDVLGNTDFDYFSKEVAQEAFDEEQKIMETGKPLLSKEERLVWPDG